MMASQRRSDSAIMGCHVEAYCDRELLTMGKSSTPCCADPLISIVPLDTMCSVAPAVVQPRSYFDSNNVRANLSLSLALLMSPQPT